LRDLYPPLPVLAPTGPTGPVWRCPLIGVDRKWRFGVVRAVVDPDRTLALSSDPFDLKPCFDLDHVWFVSRWVLKWSAVGQHEQI
jgi:hypothetical protein